MGWKACVTAGVCELMLLTLGNEGQTWTKRKEGGMEGGTGESIKGSSEDRVGDSCPTVEVIKTHKANGGWMMGAYVSIKIQQPSGRYQWRSGFKGQNGFDIWCLDVSTD